MVERLDWNRERYRTRDRLIEYDLNFYPAAPHTAGLPMIYPWEDSFIQSFAHQLYLLAKNSGYSGSEDHFSKYFGQFLNGKDIVYVFDNNFPEEGESQKLYFGMEDKTLYYWDNDYIPVNAMIIEHTILEGGGA